MATEVLQPQSQQQKHMFLGDEEPVREIKIVCSSAIRRGYEKNSCFFTHQLFKNSTVWPTKTDLCCFHCTEPFQTTPIPLPIDYDERKKIYHCGVGIFCSGACAKSYLISHPRHNNALCLMWLRQMMAEVFDVHDDFGQAPPPCSLKKFGGPLTIEAFRALNKQGKAVLMHEPRFMVCNLAFELLDERRILTETDDIVITQEAATKHVKKIKKRLKNEEEKETAANTQEKDSNEFKEPSKSHPVVPPPIILNANDKEELTKALEAAIDATDRLEVVKPSEEPPLSELLQDVDLIKADMAKRWEIRELKRPDEAVKVQKQCRYNATSSMYEEFINSKKLDEKVNALTDGPKKKKDGGEKKQAAKKKTQQKLDQNDGEAKPKTNKSKSKTRGSLDAFLT